MNHAIRENLGIITDAHGAWIRCMKCLHVLCRADEDWREASKRRLFPPTKAGPAMKELLGHFLLEQLYCPSCAVLLNTNLVEEKNDEKVRIKQSNA
jgi:hypothetical protein